MKFINDYPYTNMTAQNIDWLIKAVVDLIHEGKTDEEIKNAPGISEAYGAFCNAYPYTNMTMQNIDWLISSVRELYDKEATLEETVTKIEAQMATLQVDVDNIVDKFGDKVDKTTEPSKIYGTDSDGMPFLYTQTATETTLYSVPLRNKNGAIVAAAAQQGDEVVNLTQMDTALDGKVNTSSVNKNPTGNTIAQRTSIGTLKAATPQADDELATKKYVDDAIKTAPTGGWVTVIDKTWTEDETNSTISIDIPAEYQKAMSELRLTYYNDTPQAGAVYSNPIVQARLYDGEREASFIYTGPILPTKDTKEFNVDWISTGYNDVDNLRAFKDASGVYDKGIPTSNAMAPLNQSTITYADSQKNLDALLENRTHTVIDGTTTKTYTGTLITDLHIEPPTTTNVTAIDFGIIEQPLTVDNITNRLTFKKGDITYTVSAVAENRYDATYTTLSGTLSPAGYFVYYVSGDSSGKWQKGRLYYTQNNDATISMDNALVVTDVSATYTTNDYYSSDNADVILSQVIGSTNGKHIGELVDFNKSITACTFKWTGETAISYKNVVTRQASIVGEAFQVIAGAESAQNTMTSFNDHFINGNPLSNGFAFYSHLKNGYPTKVYLYPQSSTSNGVTAKKIYAGSRLVVQVQY